MNSLRAPSARKVLPQGRHDLRGLFAFGAQGHHPGQDRLGVGEKRLEPRAQPILPVGHLLGGDQGETTKAAAKKAGLSTAATGSILGAAAPLLMSLLGQQATQAVQAKPQSQQASSGAGLLAGLVGGAQQSAKPSGLGGLLGGLFGGSQQQSADANPLGSMMGSMLGGADVNSLLSGFLGSGK